MKITWSIKSIKHWQDGTWDALVVSVQQGRDTYDRVLSTDAFNWRTKSGEAALDCLQDELTRAAGDMLALGAQVVVF